MIYPLEPFPLAGRRAPNRGSCLSAVAGSATAHTNPKRFVMCATQVSTETQARESISYAKVAHLIVQGPDR
jgi:hypothetical protein